MRAVQAGKVEEPTGIEPVIAVLQTAPLATWVRRHGGHYILGEGLEARQIDGQPLPFIRQDRNFSNRRRRRIESDG